MPISPATPSSNAISTEYPRAPVAWYATVILAILYWLSILDRFIISLLVDPIKSDLNITDTQFAFLNGGIFAITFAVFGLIAGAMADRANRRNLIFACVSIWSLATAACGLASSYIQMLVARMGVATGEAGLNPNATSMIADLFPRNKLTSAMAVYALGSSLGAGCAYLLGGTIIEMVSDSPTVTWPFIGEIRAWQAVFFIVGIPGVLFSLILFTVPEPTRRNLARKPVSSGYWKNLTRSYAELFSFIRTRWRFFVCHYLGFGLASLSVVGNGVWYPAHMSRQFDWSAGTIGLVFGVTLVVAGFTSKFICGYFVDKLFQKGYKDAQLRWFSGCLILAAPACAIATTSESPVVFIGGLSIFLVAISAMVTCAGAALNLVTPNELRGSGMAVFSILSSLIGAAGGPMIIAWISDGVLGGNAIGQSMAIVAMVFCPLAAVVLMKGLGAMREAVSEAESAFHD